MLAPLDHLATNLTAIFARYPGCEDTDVRDHICAILQAAYIEGNPSPKIPRFFGVFNPSINLQIRRALKACLSAPDTHAFITTTSRPDRIAALKQHFAPNHALNELLGEWV